MYNNIGKKIKGLAVVIFIINALAGIISGCSLISSSSTRTMGWLLIVGGPVIGWIMSWFLYGFGELIDKISDIERNTRGKNFNTAIQNMNDSGNVSKYANVNTYPISDTQNKVYNERIEKIERLRSQGLITEEEYKQAVSKIEY